MAKNSPCYKCDERNAECHSICGKYNGWLKMHLEEKAKIDEKKARESQYKGMISESMAKVDRRRANKR